MVRCIDCGLLALREATTGLSCEADRHQREYVEIRQDRGREVYNRIPVCIEDQVDFCKELQEKPNEVVHPDRILPLINREHGCQKFRRYIPGRSPQDHQDMNAQVEIQRMQDTQREKERQWQQDQKAADRKWQLKLALFAAIFSLVASLLTLAIGLVLGKMMK
jgi:hypothetical protein